MICPRCGVQNIEGVTVCVACGQPFVQQQPQYQQPQQPYPQQQQYPQQPQYPPQPYQQQPPQYQQPQYPQQPYQPQQYNPQAMGYDVPAPQKKSRAGLIIALVFSVVVLVGAGLLVWFMFFSGGGLSGTYVSVRDPGLSMTFSGKNITVRYSSFWGSDEETSTYRIEGNRIYVTDRYGSEEWSSFRKDGDSIYIDGERFTKGKASSSGGQSEGDQSGGDRSQPSNVCDERGCGEPRMPGSEYCVEHALSNAIGDAFGDMFGDFGDLFGDFW